MDYEYGQTGKRLPLIDLRGTNDPGRNNEVEISLLVIALTGMIPGNYGDVRTGDGDGEYVTVVRVNETEWKTTHINSRTSYQGSDVIQVAWSIRRNVTTRITLA